MQSQYVVEIVSPPARPRAQVIEDLSRVFHVKPNKAEALLERLTTGPATVGKPTNQAEAELFAQRFAEIGLEVRVRAWITRPEMPTEVPHPVQAVENLTQTHAAMQAVAGGYQGGSHQPMHNPGVIGASMGDSGVAHTSLGQTGLGGTGRNDGPISSLQSSFHNTDLPATAPNEPIPASLREVDEATTPIAEDETAAPARRVSLSSKFLFASILPTVLAVGMAIGAILLTVPGALRTLQLEGARNPAIALASGVEGLLTGDALDAKAAEKLQASLNASQAMLREQNVEGVFVTDALGNPVAGWYGTGTGINSLPDSVRAYVQLQARRATAQQYMRANNFPQGTYNPPSRLTDAAGTPLEVAAHSIQRGGNAIGTATAIMNGEAVSSRVQATVLTTLLASALPVILAVLIAGFLAQSITRNVIRLVKAADRLSLGDLENPVGVRTNDELNDLGEALERMRVSLHESLERLRKRRR